MYVFVLCVCLCCVFLFVCAKSVCAESSLVIELRLHGTTSGEEGGRRIDSLEDSWLEELYHVVCSFLPSFSS